jgi:hypothetical protein
LFQVPIGGGDADTVPKLVAKAKLTTNPQLDAGPDLEDFIRGLNHGLYFCAFSVLLPLLTMSPDRYK